MKKLMSVDRDNSTVSIIIPDYNHAQFVGDAIQSVLNQDYSNFEIIVVDDGSTDNSREVIGKFGEKVRYIWQENQGLSAARNTGINLANGSFVCVLDADDMYEPAFLTTMVSALRTNPDADGIYCGYRFVEQLNNPLPQIEARSIPSNELYHALLDGNFLVPESMLVRRYCYDWAGPFDESLRACEDWDMWLRITKKFRIISTSQILTRHRILRGSMSTDPERMLNNRLAVLKKHVGKAPEDENEEADLRRRAYGRAYLGSCVERLQVGDQTRAYECFLRMATICPPLLTCLDTFYQLACGDQPKGSVGDFASLDLGHNSRVLLFMLDALFNDAVPNRRLMDFRRVSYANAYYALGLLSYGARQFQMARHFLANAVVIDPGFALNRQLISAWVKSLLGPGFVNRVKNTRRKLASL
jgi:glycosyltransferase involved in cell wall biosynthesis